MKSCFFRLEENVGEKHEDTRITASGAMYSNRSCLSLPGTTGCETYEAVLHVFQRL